MHSSEKPTSRQDVLLISMGLLRCQLSWRGAMFYPNWLIRTNVLRRMQNCFGWEKLDLIVLQTTSNRLIWSKLRPRIFQNCWASLPCLSFLHFGRNYYSIYWCTYFQGVIWNFPGVHWSGGNFDNCCIYLYPRRQAKGIHMGLQAKHNWNEWFYHQGLKFAQRRALWRQGINTQGQTLGALHQNYKREVEGRAEWDSCPTNSRIGWGSRISPIETWAWGWQWKEGLELNSCIRRRWCLGRLCLFGS